MSTLKNMVDDVYIESFARQVLDEYIESCGYEPLSEEETEKVINFTISLVKKFDIKSKDVIEHKSFEDKLILDKYLNELLSAIINLFGLLVMYKTETVILHRHINHLKERLDE